MSRVELHVVMAKTTMLSDKQIDTIFQNFDVDGDGNLNYEEFIGWLMDDHEVKHVLIAEAPLYVHATGGNLQGVVRNLPGGQRATLLLGNDHGVRSTLTSADDGGFCFAGVADGRYFVKTADDLLALGLTTGPAREISVVSDAAVAESVPCVELVASAVSSEPGEFSYHWEEDASRGGYERVAFVNQAHIIDKLSSGAEGCDEVVVVLAAADKLRHTFNISLTSDGSMADSCHSLPWNQEYAHRLLETLESIPMVVRESSASQTLAASTWSLCTEHQHDDIVIKKVADGQRHVNVSVEAFANAAPRLVQLDGVKGRFFSRRLHHAVVRWVTDNGRNADAAEKILVERYGVSTRVDDWTRLTGMTTSCSEHCFQSFHPNELVEVINTFEEMPSGFHAVKGLTFIVRRLDGMPHPLYPTAPAVAWPLEPDYGYIEFMDIAFTSDFEHMHRLILHEKSHIMWANLFSKQLKDDWATEGGWYPDPSDPEGWSTTKTTEFVSAYGHKNNPNEDMAESISYYILNPDKLRSRSAAKYGFIRDRIMHGSLFVSKIREDLTFEVLNLHPSYNYPGKIKRIDIRVSGQPEEDKTVTIEIELMSAVVPGTVAAFDGASKAYFRMFSEIGTDKDIYLHPAGGSDAGLVLRGTQTFSKYAKSGNWVTDQIVVSDRLGNERFEGMHDFGWKCILSNPLEVLCPPVYVKGSLRLQIRTEPGEPPHIVQVVTATWQVEPSTALSVASPMYCSLTNPSSDAYRLESYGKFDPDTTTACCEFRLTEYFASGTYGVPYLNMNDDGGNIGAQFFSDDPAHEALVTIVVETANADTSAPEVDLNQITITATATNPSAPNGETLVAITYMARDGDNKSGIGHVYFKLQDPQGVAHGQYHYHENFYTEFFEGGQAGDWMKYEARVVLPAGSPPGTWGLVELEVSDKANNRRSYNFTEVMHFEIVE